MYIIGYIHVCQMGNWQRSFKMLINAIRQSNLYNSVNVIRVGVVNNSGKVIDDPLLQDSKFEVMHLGAASQYERPTLLHMRSRADSDPVDTLYFYLHTKGITHFGKPNERNIIGWINLMLYWNIFRWRYATEVLKTYSIYGCDFFIRHFSGNFWWATSKHIQLLPRHIESYYIAPENWVTIVRDKLYCAYCSDYAGGGLYSNYISPDNYIRLTNTEAYMTNLPAYRKLKNKQRKNIAIVSTSSNNRDNIVSALINNPDGMSNSNSKSMSNSNSKSMSNSNSNSKSMSNSKKPTTLRINKRANTISNVNEISNNVISNTINKRANTLSNSRSKFTLSNIVY
jgi:hypothetical protein